VYNGGQGPFPENWPPAVQDLYKAVKTISAVNPNGYNTAHLSRFTLSIERVLHYAKPNAKFLCIGEKGFVPLLIEVLLKPVWLEATAWDTITVRGGLIPNLATERWRFELPDYGRNITVPLFKLDCEHEPFPYPSNTIDNVVMFNVLEHLITDPMYPLLEIHRVLKPNGLLFISTPNLASPRGIGKLLKGANPQLYSKFLVRGANAVGLSHAREYTSAEVIYMLSSAGFSVTLASFSANPSDNLYFDFKRNQHKLPGLSFNFSHPLHGSTTFIVARKARQPSARLPHEMYDAYGTMQDFVMYPNGEAWMKYTGS
jgi:SAM-dependent methyltransferase